MTPSQISVDLIKKFEGLSLKPYKDVAGHWTIGYGHLVTTEDALRGLADIDEKMAEAILMEDVDIAGDHVNSFVKVPLTQNQFDALTSFVFNLGITAFKGSRLLKYINKGDFVAAGDELLRWDHVSGKEVAGLLERRAEERELFLRGDTDDAA